MRQSREITVPLSLLDPLRGDRAAPQVHVVVDTVSVGRFMYVQESLTGTLGQFSVASDGSLTQMAPLPAFPSS